MAVTVYCTQQDIINVGLPAAALENIPVASINEACTNASSTADTYMASTYTLPLQQISPALTQATASVAAYIIRSTGGMNPDSPNDRVIRTRYEDAIRLFERVAARKATFPGVADSASPTNRNSSPSATSLPSRWSCLGGW